MKQKLFEHFTGFFADCREFFAQDAHEIAGKNWRLLRIMTLVYLPCQVLYLFFVCIPQGVKLQTVFTVAALAFHAVFTAVCLLIRRPGQPRTVVAFTIIFGAEILLLTFGIGVFAFRDTVAILFPLTMILMTQIYTLPPRSIFGLMTVGSALFLLFSFLNKPTGIFMADLIGLLVADAIGTTSFVAMLVYKTEAFRARDELRKLSCCDALTSALSRHAYSLMLGEAERVAPVNVGAVFMDINGLKRINDAYGHQKGDEMICRAADLLLRWFSPGNVYRISGDEFVVIWPGVQKDEFEAAVERMQNDPELAENKIASFGAVWDAVCPDLPAQVNQAEQNMYVSKRALYLDMLRMLDQDAFGDRVRALLRGETASGQRHAIIRIDVDHFAQINEALSFSVGSKVIEDIAGTLGSAIRAGDILGKLEGDEFILCLKDIQPDDQFKKRVEHIRSLLHKQLLADVVLSCSLGVAIYSEDGEDYDALLRHAGVALRSAKQHGRRIVYYEPLGTNAQ